MDIKIGVLGDLVLNDNILIDEKIIEILNSNNFNIVNLESPFIENEWIKKGTKNGLFQKSDNCNLLKNLNIKAVSLANNHIFDFGKKGIEKTLEKLSKEQIQFFGAGLSINEAVKPAIITIDGKKIAIFGFMMKYFTNKYFASETSSGIVKYKPEIVIPLLKSCDADFKIVYNHWNQEFEDYPEPVMKLFSEEIIEFCDVIIGSHPHCIQGIEKINNKPVFFSLGNFAMPHVEYGNIFLPKYPNKCYHSFFTILHFADGKLDYQIYPTIIDETGTNITLANILENKEITEKIYKISIPLNLDYKKYRKFYNKNKIRKLRLTFVQNEIVNSMLMFISLFLLKSISLTQKTIYKILKIIKLEKFVKSKFSKTISKVNNAK